ncbi:uncharacterized protein LOC133308918 [Gastrolobium bilobum]|uniref:uncharacterized protein LOC133308918 n=1 Tax=Gastrolobium bilobum TaxID=150636 RepID=UPI002AB319DC|nr:uncharacterized protein LOC133308918 [Gastrolobium bilobum]
MARGNTTAARPSDSSSGQSPSMEDTTSPYSLQGGDHPGLILVVTPLSGSNYNSWNRAMLLALTAKNKLIFVDGSLPRPPSSDLLFSSWNRCNSMVISWILNSVSKDISESLLYFSNAFEVWTDLKLALLRPMVLRFFSLSNTFHLCVKVLLTLIATMAS